MVSNRKDSEFLSFLAIVSRSRISRTASFGKGRLIFRVTFLIVNFSVNKFLIERKIRQFLATFLRIWKLSVRKTQNPWVSGLDEIIDFSPNLCLPCVSSHFGSTYTGQRPTLSLLLWIQDHRGLLFILIHFLTFGGLLWSSWNRRLLRSWKRGSG